MFCYYDLIKQIVCPKDFPEGGSVPVSGEQAGSCSPRRRSHVATPHAHVLHPPTLQ